MIQIYDPQNEEFHKNGDMTLFPTSCKFTAELGGSWVLEMTHPKDGEGRWTYICEEAVISVQTWEGQQLFRIDKCEKTDAEVSVVAYPIFFDSADDCFLKDTRPTGKNAQEALDIMTAGSKYSGESGITTVGTAYFVRRNLMDAINGEDSPTFTQVWGGEILFDNRKVIINERVGGDYGVEIRYGKNMDGINYTVNMSDVITRIVPVAYNGRMMSGNGYVDSANIGKYAKIYTKEVKFEDVKLAEDVENEDDEAIICQDQSALDAALLEKCEDMYAAGADLPAVTIETNMVLLADTEQYKDFAMLETVGLGDTVHCINRDLDLNIASRIISIEWDCILNRPIAVKIGDVEYDYFSELTSSLEAVNKIIGPGNTVVAERIQGVINAINTQLRYQKNVAQRQDVRAILFEDTDPESQLYGAMCLGTQGFQIANKRTTDGRDWDWTTAFTAKGGYADVLIAGILSDKTGKNYWNLDTGDLVIDGGTIKSSKIIGGSIEIVYENSSGDQTTMFVANKNGVGIGPGGETLVYYAGDNFVTVNGELRLALGKLTGYRNGVKGVELDRTQMNFYAWHTDGVLSGHVGSLKGNGEYEDRTFMGMWAEYGNALDLGFRGTEGSTKVNPILRYDPDTGETPPWIIGGASGTIHALSVVSGDLRTYVHITVKNGIITGWYGNNSPTG